MYWRLFTKFTEIQFLTTSRPQLRVSNDIQGAGKWDKDNLTISCRSESEKCIQTFGIFVHLYTTEFPHNHLIN